MEFFEGKTEKQYSIQYFPQKRFTHFCHPTPLYLKNGHVPQKLFFAVALENIAFFEKIVQWNLFKTSFPTKKVILIFIARYPLPPKFPQIIFLSFFQKYCFFRKNIRYLILNGKGYINFWCKITFSKKMLLSPKIFFAICLGNYCFHFKDCMKKYSKPHFHKKRLYSFLSPDAPFLSNGTWTLKTFFAFFLKIKLFLNKLLNNKIFSTQFVIKMVC